MQLTKRLRVRVGFASNDGSPIRVISDETFLIGSNRVGQIANVWQMRLAIPKRKQRRVARSKGFALERGKDAFARLKRPKAASIPAAPNVPRQAVECT